MKPRVLQFFGSFNQGGSERQAAALTEMLVREGRFDVRVAVLDGTGVLREGVGSLGVREIAEFPLASFYDANCVRQVRACTAFLKENNISIVHTHDFYSNVFGMAAASFARTPIRVASKRETGGMRSGTQKFVEGIAFGRADAIVANSMAVREHLTNEYGISEEKIELIYNGIGAARFVDSGDALAVRVSMDIPPNSKLVTLVANLRHEVKNVPMLLRAAAAVPRDDVHFAVAGEGDLETELQRLANDLGVGWRVHFLGRCDDVPRLLRASDVCVLTSTNEGFSNSILEYMAAGKPVVATDVGGAREAVIDGETGFLVASDDDRGLAEKLNVLLDDQQIANSFGERGRQKIAREFSLQIQLDRTIAVYERLRAVNGK
ncbi:MAG: glycosyltransferase [Acidobacteriota bacterium]|nr:MAG: glycosyltransferase [Acidobacteriota bacterium]